MSTGVSLNINQMFETMTNSLSTKAADLNSKMTELSQGDELSQELMLDLQFQVGQYNAMLEMVSTVTKSLVDECKQVAQRAS